MTRSALPCPALNRSRRSLSRSASALALCVLGACGEPAADMPPAPDAPVGKPYHYPLDEVLRLSDVQVRGTHNSYHVDTNNGEVPPWAYTHAPIYDQLDRLGIRQIELDVSYDDVTGLEVEHVATVDAGTRCRRFSACLAELRRFSDAFPGHLPIYVQIEPKNAPATEDMEKYFALLEGEILAALPRSRVLTPDEVQAGAPTLRDALQAGGWPTLSRLRGRLLFAFDTTGPIRTAYTHDKRDLRGRLLFVDSSPEQPFAGVTVLNDPRSDAAAISKALTGNLLIRTRADADTEEARVNDTRRGAVALASGAHFISTDFPEPTPAFGYRFEVPGGTPARCNPLTAPPACTPRALEDPQFVGSPAAP
ncbi:MAG: Ca2+-dependent phosphoinositide-specific phospholipase C [Polyangia bacterium]